MKTVWIHFVDGRSIRVNHEDGLYKKLRAFNAEMFSGRPFIIATGHDGEDVLINLANVTLVETVTDQ